MTRNNLAIVARSAQSSLVNCRADVCLHLIENQVECSIIERTALLELHLVHHCNKNGYSFISSNLFKPLMKRQC